MGPPRRHSVVFDVDDAANKDFKAKVLRELKRHDVKIASCLERDVGLIVSDHQFAKEIQKRASYCMDKQILWRLPSLLREAIVNKIPVEPFDSFRNHISDWIPRFSPNNIPPHDLDRRLSAAPRKPSQDEDLGKFFFKYHHIYTSYRPEGVRLDNSPVISFAEDRHLVERKANKKRKRRINASSDEVMILGSDNESGGRRYSERECKKNTKYCYRCEMVVDNMETHLVDEVHYATISAPGYFQTIDSLGKGLGLEDFIAREEAKDLARLEELRNRRSNGDSGNDIPNENSAVAVEPQTTAADVVAETEEEGSLEHVAFISSPELNSEVSSLSVKVCPEVLQRAEEIGEDPMVPHKEIQAKACDILMQKEELRFLEDLTRHLMKKQTCDDTIIPTYNDFLKDEAKRNFFIENKGAYKGMRAMLQSHINGATSGECENPIAEDRIRLAKSLLVQLRAWWVRYKRLYAECLLFKDYKKPRCPSTKPPKKRTRD